MIIDVDNTLNTSDVCHAALYDSGGDVNVGTDDPDLLVRVQGGVARQFIGIINTAEPSTTTFSNLAIAAVVEAGAAGTTSPTGEVIVRVGIKGMG